jgi:hypothetical protein
MVIGIPFLAVGRRGGLTVVIVTSYGARAENEGRRDSVKLRVMVRR